MRLQKAGDMERTLEVGTQIIYIDQTMGVHNALVTAVWGDRDAERGYEPCLNLVYTSGDESKTDPYGRQIERVTSVIHLGQTQAPGFYWKWDDEEARDYTPPTKK